MGKIVYSRAVAAQGTFLLMLGWVVLVCAAGFVWTAQFEGEPTKRTWQELTVVTFTLALVVVVLRIDRAPGGDSPWHGFRVSLPWRSRTSLWVAAAVLAALELTLFVWCAPAYVPNEAGVVAVKAVADVAGAFLIGILSAVLAAYGRDVGRHLRGWNRPRLAEWSDEDLKEGQPRAGVRLFSKRWPEPTRDGMSPQRARAYADMCDEGALLHLLAGQGLVLFSGGALSVVLALWAGGQPAPAILAVGAVITGVAGIMLYGVVRQFEAQTRAYRVFAEASTDSDAGGSAKDPMPSRLAALRFALFGRKWN